MVLIDRRRVLAGLFLVVTAVTLAILWRVLQTVFFSITVAYVLYPVRRALVKRGTPRRVAAGAATVTGFVFVAALVSPIVYALYARQKEILAFIRNIPDTQPITVFGTTIVVDVSGLLDQAQATVSSVALDLAAAAPVIALKTFLFVFLVYALLLDPERIREATRRVVPGEYHDIVFGLHVQVRDTLYALYILQAATAFGTFAVAFVVFFALGYSAAFSLAVFSGVLQFIPVLGPSLLIVAIAAGEVAAGNVTTAIVVTVVGLVFIGFLPDAVIRPQLASITTGMPASLYFVGFTGGTLSLGVVGVIAGPLAVALVVEVVELVTDERSSIQQTFADTVVDVGDPPDDGAATVPEDQTTLRESTAPAEEDVIDPPSDGE